MNSKIIALSVAAIGLLVPASQAVPVPLILGSGEAVPGTAAAAPGGVVVATTGVVNWVGVGGIINGTLETTVYSGDPNNPFAGGLTFAYKLSNGSAAEELHRMTLPGWDAGNAGASIEAEIFSDADDPDTVERSLTGVVGWEWDPLALLAGTDGSLLLLYTSSPSWVANVANLIDGDVAVARTLSPALAVPDAGGTLVLLGGGLAMLVAYQRSRSNR